MNRTPLALALLILPACDRPDGSLQDQLEALEFTATDASGAAIDDGLEATGTLAVSGTADDPSLRIATAEGEIGVDLHLPGSSELAWLDGADVTLSLPSPEAYDRWTQAPLVLSDDDGPAFVAQLIGHSPDAADATFGVDFVRYGATHGYDEKGSTAFHTRSAVVQTDDGPIDVLPGEVHAISLDGVAWRFVLIAAYEVDEPSGTFEAASKCMGPPDALSFEMVRVDLDDAAESMLVRPDALEPAIGPGCGI
jgi:hypothetical protein